jgi:hypothetical protein
LQTPNSSPFSLLHSPLSSTKYWTQDPLLLHTPCTYYYPLPWDASSF